MQRKLLFQRRSEDEEIKEGGLTLDFDEIARKGAMSKEEKSVAKWYGIYSSRHPGNHMARVVIPGGMITSTQARNIADVSEKYAQGKLNLTTRQAIQFHWLKVGNLANMMRDLGKEGSTTMHGCGDVTRNVATCALADSCRYARLNVLPYARKTAKILGDARDLDNLPRKFKITYSGCPAACGQPYMNCVGNIAVQRDVNGKTEKGFKVVIGGGMGWKAFVAQELFSFVPEDQIIQVQRAVALLFRDHGDRFNRAKSRLKFVVHRYGIDRCREIVLENLKSEGITVERLDTSSFTETGPEFPERPLLEETPVAKDGTVTVRAMVPKGELNYLQLKEIAELADLYGNQRILTTNRQNIHLGGIDPKKAEDVKSLVRKIGFGTSGFHGIADIVPCVGTTYCPKAVAETRSLHDLILPVVTQEKFSGIRNKVMINITGCPNSCSPYRIVDIGFRGMRIREELGSVEGYELLIGGSQTDHGKKLGDFKKEDCPGIVQIVLETFLNVRKEDETLTGTIERLGIEPFKEAVFREVSV